MDRYLNHKYNNFGNFERNTSLTDHKVVSNTNKIDDLEIYKRKCPKSEFNFGNILVNANYSDNNKQNSNKNNARCNSQGNLYNNKYAYESRDNSYISHNNSKISHTSSVNQYLERRHREEQEKVNKIRVERYEREIGTQNFRPKISENSRKIIKKLIQQESNSQNKTTIETSKGMARNHSYINKKPNIKFDNTFDELNDYKKIIEKREKLSREAGTLIREKNDKNLINSNLIEKTNLQKKSESKYDNTIDNNPNRYINTAHAVNNINTVNYTNIRDIRVNNNYDLPVNSNKPTSNRFKYQSAIKTTNKPEIIKHKIVPQVKGDIKPYINRNVDNNDYNAYDVNIVSETRNRLNNYYQEKKETESKHSNLLTAKSKIFEFDKDTKNNLKKPVKILQMVKNVDTTNKILQLPIEKTMTSLNIDFNQLDQFSPPNNNNIENITFNIQKAYNKQLECENKKNSEYNKVKSSYGSNILKTDLGVERKTKETRETYKNEIETKTNNENNKKKEDLNNFKIYAENFEKNKNYYTVEYEPERKKRSISSNPGKKIEDNTLNLDNEIYNNNDLYKLDSNSKSYALEKLRKLKSNMRDDI